MSEDTKKIFAEMFGETEETQASDTPKAEETPQAAETVIAVSSDEKVEVPLDGTATLSSREDEPKDEPKDEKEEDADDGVDPKELEKAKKELGIGGAAFCDELLATCPDSFKRLKDAGKTLHGFFNYAYSYALDAYVKKNGRVNGGGYWNLAELLGKYLDPSVKEGFTIGEPKVKKPTAPKPSPEVKATPAEVKKIAKKAANAAKKQREKIEKDAAKEAEKAEAKAKADAESDAKAKFLANLDKIFG